MEKLTKDRQKQEFNKITKIVVESGLDWYVGDNYYMSTNGEHKYDKDGIGISIGPANIEVRDYLWVSFNWSSNLDVDSLEYGIIFDIDTDDYGYHKDPHEMVNAVKKYFENNQ